jgi:hypothetical protein
VLVTLAAAGATRVTVRAIRSLSPGRGAGSRVLLSLCNLADWHGVRLELQAAPLDALSTGERVRVAIRLRQWYGQYGFRGPLLGWMTRTPNTVTR